MASNSVQLNSVQEQCFRHIAEYGLRPPTCKEVERYGTSLGEDFKGLLINFNGKLMSVMPMFDEQLRFDVFHLREGTENKSPPKWIVSDVWRVYNSLNHPMFKRTVKETLIEYLKLESGIHRAKCTNVGAKKAEEQAKKIEELTQKCERHLKQLVQYQGDKPLKLPKFGVYYYSHGYNF
ncbi:hypothetical protein D5018_04470 [Parashewanella curva]|uniref:Uncharacterized protein n=1 Tax=Parashewanella curva TaxID=2338552 RepID=A0A3L8Q0F0_9GAMM|nr:hypothetical protein [Parashewanella curva]RLV60900.1 hypothetical protein D5018_04470 [Parashewanella curva]